MKRAIVSFLPMIFLMVFYWLAGGSFERGFYLAYTFAVGGLFGALTYIFYEDSK